MPCGWEGNRGSASHWPCLTDFGSLSIPEHTEAHGLRKGDELHNYVPRGAWHCFFLLKALYLLITQSIDNVIMYFFNS